jgi:hypothetical protein
VVELGDGLLHLGVGEVAAYRELQVLQGDVAAAVVVEAVKREAQAALVQLLPLEPCAQCGGSALTSTLKGWASS